MKLLEQLRSGSAPDPKTLLDQLEPTFPLIGQLADTPQDPEWHAEGDVRIHTEWVTAETYRVLEQEGADLDIEDRVALILGAALHDIGKTLTTKEQEIDGKVRVVSPHHTERGRSYAAPRLPALGVTGALFDKVLGIIGHHHAPKKIVALQGSLERRYWRLSRAISPRMIYLFELADMRGRRVASGDNDEGPDFLELFRLGAVEAGAWEGEDVYAEWRERISDALPDAPEAVRDYVIHLAIEDFEKGKIHTPEEALARTHEWRDAHPQVVVTCAASGSGKSSWIAKHCPNHRVISLDEIREELGGNRDDQSQNGKVLQIAKQQLRDGLRKKQQIAWDATCIRQDGRSMVLDLARNYHGTTRLVAFASPPDAILRRNRGRKAMVPSSVIERQLDRLQWPEPWEAHQVDTIFPDSE